MPGTIKQGFLFFPDEDLTPGLAPGIGPVVAEDAERLWREAGEAIHAVAAGAPTPLSVAEELRTSLDAGDETAWRGLMAVALLSDIWPDCPPVTVRVIHAEDSPLATAVLADTGSDCLRLALIGEEGQEEVLGLCDPAWGVIPAARIDRALPLIPGRIAWLDRETGRWSDPIPALGRRERLVLTARLKALRDCPAAGRFAEDLQAREEEVTEASLHGAEAGRYQTRIKAVHCLRGLKGFEALTSREDTVMPVLTHPLLQAFSLRELLPAPEEGRVWLWRGVPFARDNGRIGLEPYGGEAEAETMETLAGELRLLEKHSLPFLRREAQTLAEWDKGAERTVSQEARELVLTWQRRAEESALRPAGPLSVACPVPDEPTSPAIHLLLRERLGDSLAQTAYQPFSDNLLLLRDGDLGDETLSQNCLVRIGEITYTAVPPLSETLTEAIARSGWTDEGLQIGSFRFEARASGHVEASLSLRGKGLVRCVRDYRPEEIQRPDAAPEVSLWPAVPMERSRWCAYYLSARGAEIRYLRGDSWEMCAPTGPDALVRTDSFPWCVALRRDGRSVGALPCRAALCHPGDRGIATVALDVGDAGVTLAISFGGEAEPIQMPSLWRMLVRGGEANTELTPLPVWPLGPVLPSAVLPRGEMGNDPQPFEDGWICPEELGDVKQPVFPLTRRVDDTGRNARRLLLREAMLLCSFHAVMHGAIGIRWRAAIPSAMDGDQAVDFVETLRACAAQTERLTGLPLAAGEAVEAVRATQAEAHALRNGGLAGSSFLMLDVGAASTGVAVWLYGMDRPALELRLRGGVMTDLLSALTARPACASDDLGEAGSALAAAAGNAADPSGKAPWRLERLFGAHMPETMSAFAQKNLTGQGTWAQAVLLLSFAARCTVGGMALEALRRDSMLSSHLPGELPLWMLGRGSRALTAMDDGTRMQLTAFLRVGMHMNHPVRAFRLALTDAPKLEAVRGLCDPSVRPGETPMLDSPITSIPTEEMAAQFLRQFALLLPGAAAMLFPGVFAPGGYLMPEMEERIRSAVRRHPTTGAQAFLDTIGTLLCESLSALAASEAAAGETAVAGSKKGQNT